MLNPNAKLYLESLVRVGAKEKWLEVFLKYRSINRTITDLEDNHNVLREAGSHLFLSLESTQFVHARSNVARSYYDSVHHRERSKAIRERELGKLIY